MDTNNLPSHLHPNVSANEFFQAVLKSFIKNESNAASVNLHYEVICKGVPLDAVLKVDITLDRLEVEKMFGLTGSTRLKIRFQSWMVIRWYMCGLAI